MSQTKILSLQKHLQSLRNRKQSNVIPLRREGQVNEYLDWIELEMKRTEKKLSELQLSLPAKK